MLRECDSLASISDLQIRQIVQECTDDKSLPVSERKQLQIKNAARHSHKVNLKFHIREKNEKEAKLYVVWILSNILHFFNS